ncbi:uncharacterized protein G2W53_015399 [Senna tora]|uniref:CCHC-type domain-containing protein n=1 Tax=Senna tora TaxID=362788 RepID=A0A835C4N8_9FABA|nr:uncharacterized protein G2W53_015399 [Senna tora]
MEVNGGLSTEEKDQMERSSKKVKMHGGSNDGSEMTSAMEVPDAQTEPNGQVSMGLVSFRDKLTGNVPEQDSVMSVSESEDDVESLSDSEESSEGEDDSSFDPCPKLKFSQEELDEWCRPWKMTLIVHLMGRSVGVTFMKNRLEKLWKRDGELTIIDLELGFYAVSFTHQSDFLYAYQEGPWMVADHYLVVQRWRPNFCPKDANEVTRIAAWVRIPSLPLEFYNVRRLNRIGGLIGKTLKVDPTTSLTSRGKFARICVEINLKKQLVPWVEVTGRSYAVEYEGLHMVCFHCGRYGHTKDGCLLNKKAEGKEKQQVDLNSVPNEMEQEIGGGDGLAPVPEQGVAREEGVDRNEAIKGKVGIFGPWMMVTRAKRGKNQVSRRNGFNYGGAKVKTGGTEGKRGINSLKSRFDVLSDEVNQIEEIKGLDNKEVFIQGWSTDPSESNISRNINGKEVVVDKAYWKPDGPQKNCLTHEQAQLEESSRFGGREEGGVRFWDWKGGWGHGGWGLGAEREEQRRESVLVKGGWHGGLGVSKQGVDKALYPITNQQNLGPKQQIGVKGSKISTPNFGKPPDGKSRPRPSSHGVASGTVSDRGRVLTAANGTTFTRKDDQVFTVVEHGAAM